MKSGLSDQIGVNIYFVAVVMKGNFPHLNLILISSSRLPYYHLAMINSDLAIYFFSFDIDQLIVRIGKHTEQSSNLCEMFLVPLYKGH